MAMEAKSIDPIFNPTAVFGDVTKKWGWLLALGIVYVVLGTIGLGMEVALTIASVMLFGGFLFAGGIFELIHAFQAKGWKGRLPAILIGLAYAAGGILIFLDPLAASAGLTLMLGVLLLVIGVMRIVLAFGMKGHASWVWPGLSGVLSIVLGLMIISKWPASGLWVIGLFVAIELIIQGWSSIFLALAARNATKAPSAGKMAA
jgi:uncharacterized membrane protein HdeD (DUF308 family)